MKEKYINLLKNTQREGIDDLINYLEKETDFFEAPASTKYHLNRKCGLLEHSLNVYDELLKECSDKYEKSKLIIVSLLHDICKANYYKISLKNVKNENTGQWEKQEYYTVNDLFPVGHGEKSVIIAQKYIKLTDDEIMAIRWHMGLSESKDNYQYISSAFNKCDLAVYLHIADLKTSYLDEK